MNPNEVNQLPIFNSANQVNGDNFLKRYNYPDLDVVYICFEDFNTHVNNTHHFKFQKGLHLKRFIDKVDSLLNQKEASEAFTHLRIFIKNVFCYHDEDKNFKVNIDGKEWHPISWLINKIIDIRCRPKDKRNYLNDHYFTIHQMILAEADQITEERRNVLIQYSFSNLINVQTSTNLIDELDIINDSLNHLGQYLNPIEISDFFKNLLSRFAGEMKNVANFGKIIQVLQSLAPFLRRNYIDHLFKDEPSFVQANANNDAPFYAFINILPRNPVIFGDYITQVAEIILKYIHANTANPEEDQLFLTEDPSQLQINAIADAAVALAAIVRTFPDNEVLDREQEFLFSHALLLCTWRINTVSIIEDEEEEEEDEYEDDIFDGAGESVAFEQNIEIFNDPYSVVRRAGLNLLAALRTLNEENWCSYILGNPGDITPCLQDVAIMVQEEAIKIVKLVTMSFSIEALESKEEYDELMGSFLQPIASMFFSSNETKSLSIYLEGIREIIPRLESLPDDLALRFVKRITNVINQATVKSAFLALTPIIKFRHDAEVINRITLLDMSYPPQYCVSIVQFLNELLALKPEYSEDMDVLLRFVIDTQENINNAEFLTRAILFAAVYYTLYGEQGADAFDFLINIIKQEMPFGIRQLVFAFTFIAAKQASVIGKHPAEITTLIGKCLASLDATAKYAALHLFRIIAENKIAGFNIQEILEQIIKGLAVSDSKYQAYAVRLAADFAEGDNVNNTLQSIINTFIKETSPEFIESCFAFMSKHITKDYIDTLIKHATWLASDSKTEKVSAAVAKVIGFTLAKDKLLDEIIANISVLTIRIGGAAGIKTDITNKTAFIEELFKHFVPGDALANESAQALGYIATSSQKTLDRLISGANDANKQFSIAAFESFSEAFCPKCVKAEALTSIFNYLVKSAADEKYTANCAKCLSNLASKDEKTFNACVTKSPVTLFAIFNLVLASSDMKFVGDIIEKIIGFTNNDEPTSTLPIMLIIQNALRFKALYPELAKHTQKFADCTAVAPSHIIIQSVEEGDADALKIDIGKNHRSAAIDILFSLTGNGMDKAIINAAINAMADPIIDIVTRAVDIIRKLSFSNASLVKANEQEILTVFGKLKNDLVKNTVELISCKLFAALTVAGCESDEFINAVKGYADKELFKKALFPDPVTAEIVEQAPPSIYTLMKTEAPSVAEVLTE